MTAETSINTISVYCGSSYPTGEQAGIYIQAIKDLGRALGHRGVHVRYGGGLYGHLKDLMEEVGEAGGTMDAILSDAYFREDETYPRHVNVVRVSSDLERAEEFLKSQAFVITPGGDGTFSESCFSHNRNLSLLFSQQSMKPVVFLNTNGFYGHVREHFNHMTGAGYSNAQRQAMLHFAESVPAAMNILWPGLSPA